MDLFVLVSILVVFAGVLLIGGRKLAASIKELNLQSISGVLVALITTARYLLFLFLAIPVMIFFHYLGWREPPNPPLGWIQHPFTLEFERTEFPLNHTALGDLGFTTITDITGSVYFGQLPVAYYCFTFLLMALWFFFAYQFLRHSETILRSLYNRIPFVVGNDILVKKIAAYGLAMALTINIGETIVGWFLSQSFSIDGIKLSSTELSLFRPLFIFAVIFVMSEVFRVGTELKEENELTV